MRKKILFLAIVFMACVKVIKSQDLIVTEKGDSINCRITKIDQNYIHFTFKFQNEYRNTLMASEKIKFFKKDFYSVSEVPLKMAINPINYDAVRISLQGGYSYMVAKVSTNVPAGLYDYVKELKSGRHLSGNITFFTSENLGFGLNYTNFNTKNEISNVYATNLTTGQVAYGSLKDDITINYFGPTVYSRFYSANKLSCFLAGFSLGYLGYNDDVELIETYKISGSTVGALVDLQADFKIDKNIALGFGLGYTVGTLSKISETVGSKKTTTKLEGDQLENISRIDLSLGLRFCF